ncbi:MAG: response regulator [Oscillospiraceae bacterium]|jgi:signal transduction histidine kinase/CheY-like chemotaxis protein|nr:response regulator [Oscillospiraceae bacterium]
MKSAEKNAGLFSWTDSEIPENRRERFRNQLLDTNVRRMLGFAIYIVVLQIGLQLMNILLPQGAGAALHFDTAAGGAFEISITYYILLSLITLLIGILYWVLLALAKNGKIKSPRAKSFLVQSLLYLYFVIQMAFCTLNILTHQGVNGQVILILLFGMIPILKPRQSIISILASFLYTFLLLLFTRGIVDEAGQDAWVKFFQTDMRAYFFIINGLTILISVFIYRLYVSNFLKSAELESVNTDLESTVRERTKELEEKTITAELASQAKSRFLASISHEIRTPLNAISGMAQIAKKAATKEKSDASVNEITTASAHLLGLLNDILDMSNIESGKLKIEKERVLLRRTLEETAAIAQMRCAEKAQTFTHNLAEIEETPILGDKLRLKQILLNILTNAVKFTPEDGKVDFSVKITENTDTHIGAAFTVTDNGVGMSEEQLSRLFIAFEQGKSGNMKSAGVGLGLAISQNLVGMMEGAISAKSTPGQGSVFTFRLRFEKDLSTESDTPLVIPDLTGRYIMVVEDIEINRIVLSGLLAETNATIEEAVDGVEAVEKFKTSAEGHYCFVFMDLLMPNMDGFEATRGIRNLDRRDAATVPIVALSANAYPEDVDKSIASGMDSHLAKPVDFAAVMRILAGKIQE